MSAEWYWRRSSWDDLPLWAVRGLWCDESDWPPDWMEEPKPRLTKEGKVIPPGFCTESNPPGSNGWEGA